MLGGVIVVVVAASGDDGSGVVFVTDLLDEIGTWLNNESSLMELVGLVRISLMLMLHTAAPLFFGDLNGGIATLFYEGEKEKRKREIYSETMDLL